jgi:hypothetical protein
MRCLTLALLALIVACVLPGRRCSALDLIRNVSKEQAKDLGITVRLQPREKDVWVKIDFKPTGPKRVFKRADLDIQQGEKRLVHASLMPRRPTPDSLYFDFYVDPAALPDAAVTIVVWEDPLTGIGYRLKMTDFMERAASRLNRHLKVEQFPMER